MRELAARRTWSDRLWPAADGWPVVVGEAIAALDDAFEADQRWIAAGVRGLLAVPVGRPSRSSA